MCIDFRETDQSNRFLLKDRMHSPMLSQHKIDKEKQVYSTAASLFIRFATHKYSVFQKPFRDSPWNFPAWINLLN